MTKYGTMDEFFWTRVRKSDGCWEWTGAITNYGYGTVRLKNDIPTVNIGAHRMSWFLHYGSLPNDLQVCHHCDNRRCVRPDHLFLGTNQDNVTDMHRKGRRVYKRATVCAKGHPKTAQGKFGTKCRECARLRLRRWRERVKKAKVA